MEPTRTDINVMPDLIRHPLTSIPASIISAMREYAVVRYDGHVFPCGAFKDGMMNFMNCQPDNVKEKRLSEIYESSGYIAKVREELARYYEDEVTEPCFGQWCRNLKNNSR